ncbi:hypothetical protein LCGC14_0921630 [marine sediment metagenome]|uniref:Transposase IS891/IS1136/IS1341 domain-containing protein n=1 Tax=marine sediment metagenome TaxID=412755 RepID=A0A0F9R9G1_9ZZZZ
MLEDAQQSYQETKKFSYPTPASYKAEHPYLRMVDSMALCNVQQNLRTAFSRFFADRKKPKKRRKAGLPRWKAKKQFKKSYTTTCTHAKPQIRIQQGKLRLPKLGLLTVVFHRRVVGKIKSATVSQTAAGQYFVSILTEQPDVQITSSIDTNKTVGIDMSFHDIAVYSNGARLKHPRWYRSVERRLARAQRKLNRRTFGSSGYERQKVRVAKIHERISNQRRDYLHKESRRLVDKFDVIVVEDINLAGMARRGRRRRFGKSIHDMSFGMFREQLRYKAEWAGKLFCKADRFYPSTQLCCLCQERNITLRGNLSIRSWTCVACGAHHDRDVNAARNLVVWYHDNNTGASPGIYADGDLATTGSLAVTGKLDRGSRKSRKTRFCEPSPLGWGR